MQRQEGTVTTPSHSFHYAALSHPGQLRELNEDAYLIQPEAVLFCVADGMGGHDAGDLASQLTLNSIKLFFQQNPTQQLGSALQFANRNVYISAQGKKMGSTVVAAQFLPDSVHLAHVGDSRAYLWKNRQLTQLTVDHSLVAELYSNGQITKEEMRTHPRRHVITAAIGSEKQVSPTVSHLGYEEGDLYLLCSDGLTAMLDDHQIVENILPNKDIRAMADQLIRSANHAGGSDNITLILIAIAKPESR